MSTTSFRPAGSSREERLAYNESWFRDLNKRKAEWIESGSATAGFRCECASMGCHARISLNGSQWEEARAAGNRFAIAPGHDAVGIETVVKEYPGFWLVEKFGKAGELAEKLA